MTSQKSYKKYFLLTIVSAVAAFAPQLSQASEIRTFLNGDMISADESSKDTYLKDLIDNLKTVELSEDYQKAFAELQSSTNKCASLKEWKKESNPILSGDFVVRKSISPERQGVAGPLYSVTLNYPLVSPDSFNDPIPISSNPSLLTQTSLAKFYKRTLEIVKDAARVNRLNCSRLAEDDSEKVSSN